MRYIKVDNCDGCPFYSKNQKYISTAKKCYISDKKVSDEKKIQDFCQLSGGNMSDFLWKVSKEKECKEKK